MTYRNTAMAIAVLKGMTTAEAAKQFGISKERVTYVVRKTCRMVREPGELSVHHWPWRLEDLRKEAAYYIRRLEPLLPKDDNA